MAVLNLIQGLLLRTISLDGFGCQRFYNAQVVSRVQSRPIQSVSDCEPIETYAPAANDMSLACKPTTTAKTMASLVAFAAATPAMKRAVDAIPSLALNTPVRNQPTRCTQWDSRLLLIILFSSKVTQAFDAYRLSAGLAS